MIKRILGWYNRYVDGSGGGKDAELNSLDQYDVDNDIYWEELNDN